MTPATQEKNVFYTIEVTQIDTVTTQTQTHFRSHGSPRFSKCRPFKRQTRNSKWKRAFQVVVRVCGGNEAMPTRNHGKKTATSKQQKKKEVVTAKQDLIWLNTLRQFVLINLHSEWRFRIWWHALQDVQAKQKNHTLPVSRLQLAACAAASFGAAGAYVYHALLFGIFLRVYFGIILVRYIGIILVYLIFVSIFWFFMWFGRMLSDVLLCWHCLLRMWTKLSPSKMDVRC